MTSKKIPKKTETTPPPTAKHTLYIDTEDEITAVIDKVVTSTSNIIAIVLPKHASVFQSIVNMKLLKKAAGQSKKNIVLITSDQTVLPIAATVGMHVAKTPSSKPEIPELPRPIATEKISVEKDDQQIAPVAAASPGAGDKVIEIDNTVDDNVVVTKKTKKDTNFRIPDFSSFRAKLLIGASTLLLLVVLWVFGFVILPKATVIVNTDTQSAPINTLMTLQVGEEAVDLDAGVLPANRAQVEKIEESTVPATGEKNIGQKATGSMNVTNCIKSEGNQIVPAGTRFSAGSTTFESVEQAILPEATFNFLGQCRSKENGDDKTVSVVAIEPGESSNVSAQTYNAAISGIEAAGSAMTGGTTEIVTVISQADIDRARQQSNGSSKASALEELTAQLEKLDTIPVLESLSESEPKVDVSPALDAQASEVTVKTTINYALLGLNEADLSLFLDKQIQDSLTDQDKNIRDNGLTDVSFRLSEVIDQSKQVFTVETVGLVGPEFDVDALKESIAGKKRGDIEKQIEAIDGVRSVSVEYSPAWITTTPKSAKKIEITFNEQDD